MKRKIQRALLWGITCAIPVVIAACYGMVMSFYKPGRVLDKTTQKGIADIEVRCVGLAEDAGSVEDAGGDTGLLAVTDAEGSFVLNTNPCDTLRFIDVDGEANGGQYTSVEMPIGAEGEELVVEMELTN
ncbi:MAG: hypothetical protein ABIJ09_05445 [Pseudomonadota bacterium]